MTHINAINAITEYKKRLVEAVKSKLIPDVKDNASPVYNMPDWGDSRHNKALQDVLDLINNTD